MKSNLRHFSSSVLSKHSYFPLHRCLIGIHSPVPTQRNSSLLQPPDGKQSFSSVWSLQSIRPSQRYLMSIHSQVSWHWNSLDRHSRRPTAAKIPKIWNFSIDFFLFSGFFIVTKVLGKIGVKKQTNSFFQWQSDKKFWE